LAKVSPDSLVDYIHARIGYPLFMLILAIVVESLFFELPPKSLESLLLDYLFNFGPGGTELLELLHLKLIKFSADRYLADNPEGIHLLLDQTHQRPLL